MRGKAPAIGCFWICRGGYHPPVEIDVRAVELRLPLQFSRREQATRPTTELLLVNQIGINMWADME